MNHTTGVNNTNKTYHNGGIFNGVPPVSSDVGLLLVQIMVMQLVIRLIRIMFVKMKQPFVISEVVGGIILGPSVLGNVPHFSETLFPSDRMTTLQVVGRINFVHVHYWPRIRH
eukprot:TRINITY_DN2687_c0_g3_i7.p1 TRINITY_DN2687_c0_g3~~TRINITY_DN2687_c0_g3_i7.p1  ORF type:complete len:113 (-),score=8.39 TRINITY_DN2687_c0_g3_i7:173-511(-)